MGSRLHFEAHPDGAPPRPSPGRCDGDAPGASCLVDGTAHWPTFPLPPWEAQSADTLPLGREWSYEPKWDGFRCLVFRDEGEVRLQSKSEQSLDRYFPEVLEMFASLPVSRFVLDGELVVPAGPSTSFDRLLQRIHPAASRVARLSRETPARFVAFDLLARDDRALVAEPLRVRRAELERFVDDVGTVAGLELTPATMSAVEARRWLDRSTPGRDGVVAKDLASPYRPGDRHGMVKVKYRRTADCVVGGFRYSSRGRVVGSLLLGLYDDKGLLHHVGFTSSFPAYDREEITVQVEAMRGGDGFTGRRPGGPSRWSTKGSTEWEPLRPRLVVEVEYDHFDEGRFRHGTGFQRWRPDKSPRHCTLAQIDAVTTLEA